MVEKVMKRFLLSSVGLLAGVALGETLDNGSLKVAFASAAEGFGIVSVENRLVGNTRFVHPVPEPETRWRLEEFHHCPNFCWPADKAPKGRADFWELELCDTKAPGDMARNIFVDNRAPARACTVRTTSAGRLFRWEGVSLPEQGGELDVVARVESAADGSLGWSIDVNVRSSRYALRNTHYPMFRRVVLPAEADYLEPRADLGAKLRRKAPYDKNPVAHGALAYAPMMTAFMIGEAGLYIGAHDPNVVAKTLYISGTRDVSFATPAPGGGFAVTLAAFKGDWWEAARRYRRWALTAPWCRKGRILDRADYPRRLCELPLWFNFHGDAAAASNALTRAKQLFPGVSTGLHWHRWQAVPWEIGHYPEYFPEDDGVKDCLAYCRRIGQEPMVYTLPRLYSKSLLSFHFAAPYAVLDPKGDHVVERYGRLEDNPPPLVPMCPGVKMWQDCIVDYSRRILDLGGRSIFQDQIASCPAKSCYGTNHNHPVGGGDWFYRNLHAICARVHDDYSACDALTTAEGSSDGFIDVMDGLLTVTARTDEDVPFWHAVYNGYTTYFGTPENHDDDDDTFWALQTREVLWGQALGWYHTLLMERPGKVALVNRLIAFRQANLDCLAYGDLLDEVRFRDPPPVRALTFLGRKSFPDWANPRAKLSPTRTGRMPGVIGYRYRSGTTGRTCRILANLMPAPQTVSYETPAGRVSQTLAAREIRRIDD